MAAKMEEVDTFMKIAKAYCSSKGGSLFLYSVLLFCLSECQRSLFVHMLIRLDIL